MDRSKTVPLCTLPLPPLGHISGVILVWMWEDVSNLEEGNIEKNCLSATTLCTITMVHKGMSSSNQLYWALILLGLALYIPRTSVSSVFMVLYIYVLNFVWLPSLSLHFSELNLLGLALDAVD